MSSKNSIVFGWLAIVILLIMFWGEPDIHDALIHYLMKD